MLAAKHYSIGEMCDAFGVTARALRFYEDENLISPERRGTTRLYTDRDRARLAWILRGKRVGLSLADIKDSSIAPAIIESCASRIFLPNPQATEPQIRTIYEGFGLNKRQIEIVATAQPKRDYYYQSRLGNRLFDLDLGPAALAFAGASTPQDQRDIDRVLLDAGVPGFAGAWLRHRGADWAADLIPNLTNLESQP